MTTDAVRLSLQDNVATVLRAVTAGERLQVRCGETLTEIESKEVIPLCHKISLSPIAAGSAIMKYGHKIGAATEPIPAGRHVHVHNMRSARGQAAS